MALSLKDPETDRLARDVARLTGESLTEAVRAALAERLAGCRIRLLVADVCDLELITPLAVGAGGGSCRPGRSAATRRRRC
jgi:hypothetical protein